MRPPCRRRGECHDRASSSLLHPWQKALQGEKRRREICVDDGSPSRLRQFFHRSWRRHVSASVRDEHVDWSQRPLDLEAHPFDIAKAGDVGDERSDASAVTLVFDRRLNLAEGVAVASVQRDRRSFRGK